jgi:stage III sporulation protein AA
MRDTVKEIVERDILTVLPDNIKGCFEQISDRIWTQAYEIRLRVGQSPSLSMSNGEVSLNELPGVNKTTLMVEQEDISKALGIMSQNSIYAIQEEVKAGFLTLRGGHRVGLAGKVISCSNSIQNIKYFSSLNIRIARQIIGSANKLLDHLISRDGFINTLIISPPRCGKTTILRDIIRQVSNGISKLEFAGQTVGVVDERSELAACYKGIPQNDIGVRTDVMDNCPKAEGIMMMVRSMGPNIIATDEIGSTEDARAIMTALSAGIGVVTTAHGCNVEDISLRQGLKELISSKAFGRIVILGRKDVPGVIKAVYDGLNLKPIAVGF